MLDLKKENTNIKNNPETVEEDVPIHTMQEDLDALSGIFPKNKRASATEEEKKVISNESKAETRNGQYFNPFLEKQIEQEKGKITDFSDKTPVSDKNVSNKQESQENTQAQASSKKFFWIVLIVIAIIGVSACGGYYYFNKKNIVQNESQQAEDKKIEDIEAQEPQNSEDLAEAEIPLKYSFDKPNYLSIDTENPGYENFKEIVSKAFLDIKDSGINEPVEFVITDSKNNPIAFPIFSAITNLNLSNELLKNLSDDFSVFAYFDSGNPRLVLSIKVIDKMEASTLIKNEETKLPEELLPLFLDNISLSKEKAVFKDANYRGVNIRYFNLTPDQLSTIDYFFNDTHLIIATSKNSMWAVLDKMLNRGEQE